MQLYFSICRISPSSQFYQRRRTYRRMVVENVHIFVSENSRKSGSYMWNGIKLVNIHKMHLKTILLQLDAKLLNAKGAIIKKIFFDIPMLLESRVEVPYHKEKIMSNVYNIFLSTRLVNLSSWRDRGEQKSSCTQSNIFL